MHRIDAVMSGFPRVYTLELIDVIARSMTLRVTAKGHSSWLR